VLKNCAKELQTPLFTPVSQASAISALLQSASRILNPHLTGTQLGGLRQCKIRLPMCLVTSSDVVTPALQAAARRVAFYTFSHVLGLDIQFHLDRRTGRLSRILERGGARGWAGAVQAKLQMGL
jgi:hypothetical protein